MLYPGQMRFMWQLRRRQCRGGEMLCSLHPSKSPPDLADQQPLDISHINAIDAIHDYNSDYPKLYSKETVGYKWTTD